MLAYKYAYMGGTRAHKATDRLADQPTENFGFKKGRITDHRCIHVGSARAQARDVRMCEIISNTKYTRDARL